MNPAPEFARIRIDASAPPVWLRTAAELLSWLTKPPAFRFVSLTDDPAEAIVLTPHHAAWVLEILQRTYAGAHLEPATFEDWICSPVGAAYAIPSPIDAFLKSNSR